VIAGRRWIRSIQRPGGGESPLNGVAEVTVLSGVKKEKEWRGKMRGEGYSWVWRGQYREKAARERGGVCQRPGASKVGEKKRKREGKEFENLRQEREKEKNQKTVLLTPIREGKGATPKRGAFVVNRGRRESPRLRNWRGKRVVKKRKEN